ncbi:SH3 domain-containing protein [Streptomyces sp. TRM S81-3]|uniref:SH3 domain-containing protein n=1 Tax=Streptomyces griseicoloratus TaxID=2752516 RepID=A0A926L4S2_9ACTN|nr:SH3 domain-containing protein [Streptomyces griseicoloratus]MBD0422503.1 SH3 domain-containing protein [Streptomyces griseicoloratus]
MSIEHAAEVGSGDERDAVTTAATTATYPVAPGVRLNVRSGPGTGYAIVRVLPEGTRVSIYCQTPGTWVTGPYGTSNIWDNIGSGQYVSDTYVLTGSDGYFRPRCS